MGSANTWTFPSTIDFSIAAEYLRVMEGSLPGETLVLDLKATEVIHSSFIGFLIHAKERIEDRGGILVLKISPALRKTLKRLNLDEYFAPSIESGNSVHETRVTLN
jgi:anti-anti-sigma regulatory factor